MIIKKNERGIPMDKQKIRNEAFNFLSSYGPEVETKFRNICSKTGRYNVPIELFQKRTSRKNRVLISWKTVQANHLTLEQLESFSGGVAVEFINDDFFNEANQLDPLFNDLKGRIGSDKIISSIISIRSEFGSSSSKEQRDAFQKLINNTKVNYQGNTITINASNYLDYAIRQTATGGTGNEKWKGFLFISIKGGQQETIESHSQNLTIFNPACEFANKKVCIDLDLVMAYFALISIDKTTLISPNLEKYQPLIEKVESALKSSVYDNASFSGNLLDYCQNHPCMKFLKGKLCDPIQVEEIKIDDFSITDKTNSKNLDFTHNEAVLFEKFYWDSSKKCILSPARPTNVFWSRHLSNMMQQNFTLDEYFQHEEEIVSRRKSLI